ncbi:MAG: phosphoadenylyl-sulfate reductase [Actinomycetota bacterium]|nr:phosphoadenylyl-sulfate reductase [Actinomycetota bacterium]
MSTEVLRDAVDRFGDGLVVACSFQKEESVLLDLLLPLQPDARVFTIDTGVLFPETLQTWRAFEERWDLKIEVVDAKADPPWTGNGHCCSNGAKAAALDRALEGATAWVTGLRREQAPTRESVEVLARDRRGLWKVNPLADWTDKDVWAHIAAHDLPYNPLHDRGYASIGCAPCTRPGEGREGRWAGQDKTECGLHVEA